MFGFFSLLKNFVKYLFRLRRTPYLVLRNNSIPRKMVWETVFCSIYIHIYAMCVYEGEKRCYRFIIHVKLHFSTALKLTASFLSNHPDFQGVGGAIFARENKLRLRDLTRLDRSLWCLNIVFIMLSSRVCVKRLFNLCIEVFHNGK